MPRSTSSQNMTGESFRITDIKYFIVYKKYLLCGVIIIKILFTNVKI